MRLQRRTWVGVLALVLVVLVVGCGLPTDDEPQELSADAVPFDLLAGPSTTLSTRPEGDTTQIVNLYFRDDERLVPVPTEVTDSGDEVGPRPDIVIQALLDTTSAELEPGIRSAIPPDTALIGTGRVGDVLTIDLTEPFTTVEGNLLIFAVAQLVYTSTGLTASGIERVQFAIDGERISVPDDEGVEQDGPVSTDDYLSLAPLPG